MVLSSISGQGCQAATCVDQRLANMHLLWILPHRQNSVPNIIPFPSTFDPTCIFMRLDTFMHILMLPSTGVCHSTPFNIPKRDDHTMLYERFPWVVWFVSQDLNVVEREQSHSVSQSRRIRSGRCEDCWNLIKWNNINSNYGAYNWHWTLNSPV